MPTAPAKTATSRRRPTRKTAPAKTTPSAAESNRVVRHTSYPRVSLERAEARAAEEGRPFAEVLRAFVKAYGEHRLDA